MAYQSIHAAAAWAGVVVTIALALGVGACNAPATVPTSIVTVAPTVVRAAQGLTTVHAASATMAIGVAGQILAQTEGYFAEEGLAIDSVTTDPSTTLAAMLAGQIDVAGIGMDAGLFTSMQRGVDIRIVGPQATSDPGANSVFFVVRKDLIDGGRVQQFADLRGLKIAVSARGNSNEYVVAKALEAGGLTIADADLTVLNFPAMVSALSTRAIDVGMLPEPLATVAEENGAGVKWKGYADVVPGIQNTVVIFSPHFAAQRDVATRWMTAYLRGIRDYNDAFVKGIHRQITVDTLAPVLSIDPKLFESVSFTHIDPNGKLNLAAMEDQMRWSVEIGYLSAPVDLNKVVDTSFAEAAVAQLGPYQ